MILTSLSVGFSRCTVWCSTLPNSVLSTNNLYGGFSSELRLRSYHISPKVSWINAIDPYYLPTNKGENNNS